METTPVTPAVRTAKVRIAKAAVPKSSSPTTKSVPAARKNKTLTKKSAPPTTAIDLCHMIATAAYYLAEQRQFAPGYELQDWLTAEQQILGRSAGN